MFHDSGLATTVEQDNLSGVQPICLAWDDKIQLPKNIFVRFYFLLFFIYFSNIFDLFLIYLKKQHFFS
jgi:hypothetical protein